MRYNSPIGVFDSGFGGLTIFRRILERLPQYDYIYLGDNARTPYGNRSFETVLKFATQGVEHLFSLGCRLVVIACNTASAKALRTIQQAWLPLHQPERRVLGVIRPTVESIKEFTRTDQVALWATPGTVRSDSFAIEIAKHAPRVTLHQQACPMLVPLVEAGELEGPGVDYYITKYWGQTAARSGKIDTLLLGCTHYPLLMPRFSALLPSGVRIVEQGSLVAPSLEDYLNRHPEIESKITKGGSCRYLTTDRCEYFDELAVGFMGRPIASEKAEIDA
jgi:glutamate racemase